MAMVKVSQIIIESQVRGAINFRRGIMNYIWVSR
jgi:hypothetical protein